MKLAIQCAGCGEVVRAGNETVMRLRLKRHAGQCKPLHQLAKARILEAAKRDRLASRPMETSGRPSWWRRVFTAIAFWRRRG